MSNTFTPIVVERNDNDAVGSDPIERRWAQLWVPPMMKHYKRKWNGLDEDTILDIGIREGDNFLFTGDAGTGKTQTAMHLASRLGVPFLRQEMHHSLSQQDIEGRPMPKRDGGWFWLYSRLATAIQQPSVILLNEFSRSHKNNTTLFLGLLNERQLQIESLNEIIPVHPKCIFIADQNEGSYYIATQQQDPALMERFGTKLQFDYDPVIESELIPSPSLLEVANSIRSYAKQNPAQFRTRLGLRFLLNFVKHARNYNFEFAVDRFLANFSESEQESVRMHFEARYQEIAQELQVSTGAFTND